MDEERRERREGRKVERGREGAGRKGEICCLVNYCHGLA